MEKTHLAAKCDTVLYDILRDIYFCIVICWVDLEQACVVAMYLKHRLDWWDGSDRVINEGNFVCIRYV